MFKWSNQYSVGIPEIDKQHRGLFVLINELHEAMKNRTSSAILGRTLDKLVAYTVEHFTAEETMMRTRGFGAYIEHKKIHDEFTAKIRQLQSDHKAGALMINLELMDTLRDWLVNHIQGADMQYAKNFGHVA